MTTLAPPQPAQGGATGAAGGRALLVVAGLVAAVASVVLGVLVAGQPLLTLAALATLFVAAAMLTRPDAVTLVVIFVLYTNAAVVAVIIHGVPAFVGAALPVLLLGPLGYHLFLRRGEIVITPAVPWIVLFLFAHIAGAMLSNYLEIEVDKLFTFVVEGLGLYLLITNAVRAPAILRGAIWTILLAGAILGSISLLQQVTGMDNDYFGFGQTDAAFGTGTETLRGEVRQVRLAGPIGEQNRYGQMMALVVAIGLYQALAERRLAWRLAAVGATFLGAVGAVLSFSRGAILGMGLMLVILVLLRYLRLRTLVLVVVGAIAVTALIPQVNSRLAMLGPVIAFVTGEQSAEEPDNSVVSRATENIAAVLVFADHPVFGVGPGGYPEHYREYANEVGLLVKAENREAHSLVLHIAAENGIVGLVALTGAIGVTLYQLAQARRQWLTRRPDLAYMATGLFAAIVAYLTTGLFLHMSYIRYFWLILALAGAAAYIARHQPDPDEPQPGAAG